MMNLERGFRRITIAASVGFLLVGAIRVGLFTPEVARIEGRETAREIIAAGDKDFRESKFTTQTEILEGLLRRNITPRDEVLGLAAAAKRAARFAQAKIWVMAIAVVVLFAILPWAVFFVARWIARGFFDA